MNNVLVSLQVIQTSKTLLENSEGVYERILQTQKAGKRQSAGRITIKGGFLTQLLNACLTFRRTGYMEFSKTDL